MLAIPFVVPDELVEDRKGFDTRHLGSDANEPEASWVGLREDDRVRKLFPQPVERRSEHPEREGDHDGVVRRTGALGVVVEIEISCRHQLNLLRERCVRGTCIQ